MPEINKDQLVEHIHKSDLNAEEKRFLEKLVERTRWIPCKERLPEEGQAVIGCDRGGSIARFFQYEGDIQLCWTIDHEEYFTLDQITHWMPLPEPPEREEEQHES